MKRIAWLEGRKRRKEILNLKPGEGFPTRLETRNGSWAVAEWTLRSVDEYGEAYYEPTRSGTTAAFLKQSVQACRTRRTSSSGEGSRSGASTPTPSGSPPATSD